MGLNASDMVQILLLVLEHIKYLKSLFMFCMLLCMIDGGMGGGLSAEQ
jgi:hypothetical protein